MPNYQQGYEQGRNEQRYSAHTSRVVGQGIGTLIAWVFILGTRVAAEALITAPFIILGFVAVAPLDFLGPMLGAVRLVGMGLVAYLSYAGLFWLKGLVVALRHRRGRLWLLPFSVCMALACLLPGYLAYRLVTHALPTANPVWGWGVGVAFALFAYGRYRFTENSAPKLIDWSYRRGYRWANDW